MKLSKEQAIQAVEGGSKYIYRYIWKTEPLTPDMAATNLLSTQARIVKINSRDFHRELKEDEFGVYVDHFALCKKAKSLTISLKHNGMKGFIGEHQAKLMEVARPAKQAGFTKTSTGLKGMVDLELAAEHGEGMASSHAAGKGHRPDVLFSKKYFGRSSDGIMETLEVSKQTQVKNYTGTKGAEYKAEASANKSKNMENAPGISQQVQGKITILETDEVLIQYDTYHLVTFMVGKPKLDQGASKYYIDEKVWHDPQDLETIENLKEMEDYSTIEKQLEYGCSS